MRKRLWSPGAFSAGEHFGAQNAFWVPKTHLGLPNALLGPKAHFWSISRPGSKSLLNKWFQEPFWGLWEPKTENELILALLAPKVQNDPLFCILLPKSGKMNPFSHFASKSAKKEPRNPLFNRPFEPGRKMDPKKRFWTPKTHFGAILGPKSHFVLHKRTFGPEIAFWGSFCALAQKAY